MKQVMIELGPNHTILVTIPSDVSELTHTVSIPMSLGGLATLKKLLTERAKYGDRRIATEASPVQAQIELWLHMERLERNKQQALPDLDLTLGDLADLELDL